MYGQNFLNLFHGCIKHFHRHSSASSQNTEYLSPEEIWTIFPGSNKIVNTKSVPNYLALEIFTDVSKADTRTGCSVVYMFKGAIFYTQQFSFDKDINIFQAEVFAIGKACRFIVDHNVDATIYTDSKSSIDALTSENCIYEQCC